MACSHNTESTSDYAVRVDSVTQDDNQRFIYHGAIITLAPKENFVSFTREGLLDVIQQTRNQIQAEKASIISASETINNKDVSQELRLSADSALIASKTNVDVLISNLEILQMFLIEIDR